MTLPANVRSPASPTSADLHHLRCYNKVTALRQTSLQPVRSIYNIYYIKKLRIQHINEYRVLIYRYPNEVPNMRHFSCSEFSKYMQ